MRVILLSGWKGSGKDTAADYLSLKHKYVKLSFADPLKELVARQYNIPLNWFYDRTLKETPLLQYPVQSKDDFSKHVNDYMYNEHFKAGTTIPAFCYHTPRSLCILEGSIKRSVDANYWVKQAVAAMDPSKSYVLADWRYRSEHEAMKPLVNDLITIRLERSAAQTTSVDPSERDLDNFNFDDLIVNNGDKSELYASLDMSVNAREKK